MRVFIFHTALPDEPEEDGIIVYGVANYVLWAVSGLLLFGVLLTLIAITVILHMRHKKTTRKVRLRRRRNAAEYITQAQRLDSQRRISYLREASEPGPDEDVS